MNILSEIVAHKRHELVAMKNERPLEVLMEQTRLRKPLPGFLEGLQSAPMGLIAEVKHMSPSAGIIRSPFDPERIAEAYEKGGAQAVSVLMDKKYFDGGEKDFRKVRAAIGLPMLYKEFVVDPWQIWHASACGASAALLIVSVLAPKQLADLMAECERAGLQALVEVHDEEELQIALGAGAVCIGVNNRDLKTFTVSLDTSIRLKDKAPADTFIVSESGIRNAGDVVRLREHGIRAVLVGEHLLKRDDLAEAVAALMGDVWASS